MERLLKLMIIITILINFTLVLGGAVVSVLTFHMIAAGFGGWNKTFTQNLTDQDLNQRCLTQNGSPLSNYDSTETYKVTFHYDEGAAAYWALPLLVTTLTPVLLTLLHAFYRVLSSKKKDKTQPQTSQISQMLVVIITEVIQVFGLSLLTFYILPFMGPFASISMGSCTALIPAFLSFLTPSDAIIHKHTFIRKFWYLIHFFAICALLTIFAAPFARIKGWDAENDMGSGGIKLSIVGGISVIMFGIGFLDNFTHSDLRLPKCLKWPGLKEANPYLELVTGLLKIGTIIALFFVALEFNDQIPNVFLEGLSNHRVLSVIEGHQSSKAMQNITCWPYHSFTWFNGSVQLCWGLVILQTTASIITVLASIYACKAAIQNVCMCLPLAFFVPAVCLIVTVYSESLEFSPSFWNLFKPFPFELYQVNSILSPLGNYRWVFPVTWSVFFLVTSIHIWFPDNRRLKASNEIFSTVTYFAPFIDRSLLLLRRRDFLTNNTSTCKSESSSEEGTSGTGYTENVPDNGSLKKKPHLLVCTTMWHETKQELRSIMRSILKLDHDQRSRELLRKQQIQDEFGSLLPNEERRTTATFDEEYYTFEVHIMFDDAFLPQSNPGDPLVMNSYVQDLQASLKDPSVDIYNEANKIPKPDKYSSPYGGQLVWMLPESGSKMVAHLKCKQLVRNKKRWSQVMYMYYLLTYKLGLISDEGERKETLKSSFILTLDGDVDFQPKAALHLLDVMMNNSKTGSVCGRIHPLGTGWCPMIWYQRFEYAVGHWLQKAAEDTFGCVLCSPGCFALFRGKAIVDSNVLSMYRSDSVKAKDYVQHDQGEDGWLSILLLKQGWGIRYAAAADAYTFAPGNLKEFYQQRRRWMPSTMANQIDLLRSWRQVLNKNRHMTILYMGYQLLMLLSTLLGPGEIFLMLLGALKMVFLVNIGMALLIIGGTVLAFAFVCFLCKSDTQLKVSLVLTIICGLVMLAVLVALALQAHEEGVTSPNVSFLLLVIAIFVITGILHLQEFLCLVPGVVYFLAIPGTYMLLTVYTVCNVNVVSWGTREAKPPPVEKQTGAKEMSFWKKWTFWLKKMLKCSAIVAPVALVTPVLTEAETIHPAELLFDVSLPDTLKLEVHEQNFWVQLLDKYLHPIQNEDKKRIDSELKTLRKWVALTFFGANITFVLIIFLLELHQTELSFQWPISECSWDFSKTAPDCQYLQVEPVSIAFFIFFIILLAVQFFGMLLHRFQTWMHLVATTTHIPRKNTNNTPTLSIKDFREGLDVQNGTIMHI